MTPWRYRSAACCLPHQPSGASESYVSYCQYLALGSSLLPLPTVLQPPSLRLSTAWNRVCGSARSAMVNRYAHGPGPCRQPGTPSHDRGHGPALTPRLNRIGRCPAPCGERPSMVTPPPLPFTSSPTVTGCIVTPTSPFSTGRACRAQPQGATAVSDSPFPRVPCVADRGHRRRPPPGSQLPR